MKSLRITSNTRAKGEILCEGEIVPETRFGIDALRELYAAGRGEWYQGEVETEAAIEAEPVAKAKRGRKPKAVEAIETDPADEYTGD